MNELTTCLVGIGTKDLPYKIPFEKMLYGHVKLYDTAHTEVWTVMPIYYKRCWQGFIIRFIWPLIYLAFKWCRVTIPSLSYRTDGDISWPSGFFGENRWVRERRKALTNSKNLVQLSVGGIAMDWKEFMESSWDDDPICQCMCCDNHQYNMRTLEEKCVHPDGILEIPCPVFSINAGVKDSWMTMAKDLRPKGRGTT